MKSGLPDKKKKLKLKVDHEYRYRLLGISCHENDYRLVWAINSQMKMQFVRTGNQIIHNQKLNQDLEFSRYTYRDEDKYLTYNLVSNRCPDGFLLPELSKIDYLLQIIGDTDVSGTEGLMKSLRKIEIISAVFQVQPGKIKNPDRIDFD